MADKYLADINGYTTEVEATTISAGAGTAGKIVALNANGKIDDTMMPPGIGADTFVAPASETLSEGDLVNIFDDSGTIKVRLADASGGVAKKADGFVTANYSINDNVTVYLDGTNNYVTSRTPIARQYLSTTPGKMTETPPSTAGHIRQGVGKAVSATSVIIEIEEPVVQA